ncbi:MAG TPA: ABC transporter ATP-binding protein, partial [Candidatus Binataceae bacterium]|nr:ABC transporter ATP-binding protein [Candidatus Binataceae bacterium]
VIRVGRRFIVTDGHKRLTACKQRNMSHVMVELWTIARWLEDLRSQTLRKSRQVVVLTGRSTVDRDSRKAAVRLFWDIVGHWKRIFTSIAALLFAAEAGGISSATDDDPNPAEPSRSVFRRLVNECTQFPGHLLLITFSLGALGGSQLYLTWLAKLWSEGPLVDGNRHVMARLLFKALITSVIFVLSLFGSRYFLRSLNQLLVQSLRDRAQRHVLAVELSSARRLAIGELISRMFNDAGMLTNFVREILRRAIGESVVVVGALAMAFYLNWRLALVMSLVGPLVAVILSSWGRMIRRQSEYAQRELGTLSSALSEQLSGLSTIKGFQTEPYESRRFGAQDSLYRAHMLRTEVWMALMMSSVWAVTCAGLIGVVWYGTSEVFAGSTTRGALLAFCLYAVQTVEPLRRLSEVHGLLQRALAAAGRVFEVIDLPCPERSGNRSLAVPVRGELNFKDLNFHYDPEHQILRNFDLAIAPHEMVALVAASGGGKSTIANLLLRLVDPPSGRILLDGIDLRELRLDQLRRVVCVIEQESFVFSGSLLDNIRYGSFEASRKNVEDAVSLAGLDEFVEALPGRLDGFLAEAGRNLSGGQKQRIALARGIVRNPAVLVLDEATSALDGETERAVFDRMQSWLAQRTVLVMSHRLATVTRFPRVVAFEDGTIVGDGGALELLQTCPVFGTLFAEQLTPLENARSEASS